MTQAAGGRPLAREKPALKVRAVSCAKELERLGRREGDLRLRIDDEESMATAAIRSGLHGVE